MSCKPQVGTVSCVVKETLKLNNQCIVLYNVVRTAVSERLTLVTPAHWYKSDRDCSSRTSKAETLCCSALSMCCQCPLQHYQSKGLCMAQKVGSPALHTVRTARCWANWGETGTSFYHCPSHTVGFPFAAVAVVRREAGGRVCFCCAISPYNNKTGGLCHAVNTGLVVFHVSVLHKMFSPFYLHHRWF